MSSRFRQVFANRHVVLPVIHVKSPSQAVRNARLARDLGCDGVFLINHGISYGQLITAHTAVNLVADLVRLSMTTSWVSLSVT